MSSLFTAEFLQKLEQLKLLSRNVFTGKMKGERRSRKRGASVEFADYRNYVQGDEFRHIDWYAYARLENLFLKLFMEEEDLSIYFLIDGSHSMAFPAPQNNSSAGRTSGEPWSKFAYAKRIVGALSYIALANLDRVAISLFNNRCCQNLPLTHGPARIFKIFRFLEQIEPAEGITDLTKAVTNFLSEHKKRGLVVIISDLMNVNGYESGLRNLKFYKYEPMVIHLFAPAEINPPPGGDWRLIDSETGGAVEISLSHRIIKTYQQRLNIFCEQAESYCRSLGINYLRTTTDTDFEDLILKYLKQAQMVG
ncbi:MAG: DUF58 domain-containing protein [Planctomycetota bacterium]